MSSALLIRGGTVVNADRAFRADVLIEGDTIAAVGENLAVPAGATVIDAGGFSDDPRAAQMFVTPRDIDTVVRDAAKLIGYGINLALHDWQWQAGQPWRGALSGTIGEIASGSASITELSGKLTLQADSWQGELQGQLLEGTLSATGHYQPSKRHLTLDEVQLAQWQAELAAKEKAAAEAEAARIAMFAEFVDYKGYSAPSAEKARRTLLKPIRRNGAASTIKELVETLVEDGRFIGDDDGKRVLEHPDGRFVAEKYIGKTGMDYAEYLISRWIDEYLISKRGTAAVQTKPKGATS